MSSATEPELTGSLRPWSMPRRRRRIAGTSCSIPRPYKRLRRYEENASRTGPGCLRSGSGPRNPDRIGAWWRRARSLAGIDAAWRLHDLRHWSATLAIANGHDVRTVGHRLGHANAAMTLHYAHPSEAVDRAVATTLASALAATSDGRERVGRTGLLAFRQAIRNGRDLTHSAACRLRAASRGLCEARRRGARSHGGDLPRPTSS